ncbi:uncharacterized protein LOC119954284 [Scyliorhinus canicula]|uniref:uncharacterized protein LOC119954284 n=1 Tax=Scyliorhinus canicula TaxID=7830 RepID=UPI0018F47227|nr:uncharacterized protein LOC119954284 [Scyliorhinus canicula]
MKILAAITMILVVKGTQGAAIPANETQTNNSVHVRQLYWDISNIMNELTGFSVNVLAQTEVGKAIIANLTDFEAIFNNLFESSLKHVTPLSEDITWKGRPIKNYLLDKSIVINTMLLNAVEQLNEVIGNETVSDMHEKLLTIQKTIGHHNLNDTEVAHNLDDLYHEAIHELEETPLAAPYAANITKRIQDVKHYLTSVVQATKDGFQILAGLGA